MDVDMDFQQLRHHRSPKPPSSTPSSSRTPWAWPAAGAGPVSAPRQALAHRQARPTATLAALAMVTNRIGLVVTATTTGNEPYNIACRFARSTISRRPRRLEPVTSQIDDESEFRLREHPPTANATSAPPSSTRSSSACGTAGKMAAAARQESGVAGPRQGPFLDHVGKHFKVKGPLNIALAAGLAGGGAGGSSEAAASSRPAPPSGVHRSDQDHRPRPFMPTSRTVPRAGRGPDDIKIMPGLTRCWAAPWKRRASYEYLRR
jgi:hypothetical protein